ncbi:MAG: transcriptional regulator [Ferruginibacter sp.]|nr:transcriptional regulator [Ferruginibacter sp.]
MGRNVKRFREMLGIKQEGLAYQLGDDWNQQRISALEQKELIDDPLLDQVAKLLKVPAEAIKNFDEEAAVNVISNTFTSNDASTLNAVNHQCTFNTLDKIMEQAEEIKSLYVAWLKEKEEKIVWLEKLLAEKNSSRNI